MRISMILIFLGLGSTAFADSPPHSDAARVIVPLESYHQLTRQIEAAEEGRRALETVEAPVHAILGYDADITVAGETASLETRLEVEVRGLPRHPVPLPVAGLAHDARVEPADGGAALHRDGDDAMVLVAPEPGRYRVTVSSRLDLADGVLHLPASPAAVTTATLDVAAGLELGLGDAVTVSDELSDDRRRIRLTLQPGRDHDIDLRPRVDAESADDLILNTAVITVVEVLREHLRRRDVVLFEVLRGSIDRFELDLPRDYALDRVDSDEGATTPRLDGTTLTVERRETLHGRGHVMVTARPRPLKSNATPTNVTPTKVTPTNVTLAPIEPSAAPRERFLVLAPAIATRATPRPADAWRKVDLEDLPASLTEAISALGPSGVWRMRASRNANDPAVWLDVAPLPAARRAGAVIESRATTSLLTNAGVLVHRDRLTVAHAESALAIALRPEVELWSALVDGEPVRPVTAGGRLLVPIAYRASGEAELELVTMARQPLPDRRDSLSLSLPTIEAPVLSQTWKLLLPAERRYRFAASDLEMVAVDRAAHRLGSSRHETRAAVASSTRPSAVSWNRNGGNLHGTITTSDGSVLPGVTVELAGIGAPRHVFTDGDGRFRFHGLDVGSYRLTASLDGFSTVEYPRVEIRGRRDTALEIVLSVAAEETITVTAEAPLLDFRGYRPQQPDLSEQARKEAFELEAGAMAETLTSGVKPLAIRIPESGKLLLLSGALPPPNVGVVINVRPGKR